MNAAIFPCKNDPLPMTIWDLYNNYKGAYAPEEFQRPESWSNKERKAYFLSVLMNRIEGTFVFVDVEIAADRVGSIDPTDISFTYFNNLLMMNIPFPLDLITISLILTLPHLPNLW